MICGCRTLLHDSGLGIWGLQDHHKSSVWLRRGHRQWRKPTLRHLLGQHPTKPYSINQSILLYYVCVFLLCSSYFLPSVQCFYSLCLVFSYLFFTELFVNAFERVLFSVFYYQCAIHTDKAGIVFSNVCLFVCASVCLPEKLKNWKTAECKLMQLGMNIC